MATSCTSVYIMYCVYIVCVFLWCMGNTFAIILNFYWSMRICLKITKMVRPHRRQMSKWPDCYELRGWCGCVLRRRGEVDASFSFCSLKTNICIFLFMLLYSFYTYYMCWPFMRYSKTFYEEDTRKVARRADRWLPI